MLGTLENTTCIHIDPGVLIRRRADTTDVRHAVGQTLLRSQNILGSGTRCDAVYYLTESKKEFSAIDIPVTHGTVQGAIWNSKVRLESFK